MNQPLRNCGEGVGARGWGEGGGGFYFFRVRVSVAALGGGGGDGDLGDGNLVLTPSRSDLVVQSCYFFPEFSLCEI